jgi:hypothetical protein
MLPVFSPQSLNLGKVFVNTTGPVDDLDLNDPIPFPSNFPGTIHSDPAPRATSINVAIQSPLGTFQIRDSILFDVGMVSIFDQDVGHFVRIKAYTFAGSHAGPGSIAVGAGQVLVVRVAFAAGPDPGIQAGQVLIADADSGVASIPVSLQTIARGEEVVVDAQLSEVSIVQSRSAIAPIRLTSRAGPDTQITFFMVSGAQGIVLDPPSQSFLVPQGATVTANLNFVAQSDDWGQQTRRLAFQRVFRSATREPGSYS